MKYSSIGLTITARTVQCIVYNQGAVILVVLSINSIYFGCMNEDIFMKFSIHEIQHLVMKVNIRYFCITTLWIRIHTICITTTTRKTNQS